MSALALAVAAWPRRAIVRLLLDAGEDPRPLQPRGISLARARRCAQAVWSGDHVEVVQLLVARGARLDIRDTLHTGTALDWAIYGGRTEIADYLRSSRGSTTQAESVACPAPAARGLDSAPRRGTPTRRFRARV